MNVTIFVKNVIGTFLVGDDSFGQNDTIEESTGATATVVFYHPSDTFSVGDDYGQNAEIKFIGTQVDPTMGEIQFVSLGFASAGIGKMLVFQAPSDITLQTEDTLNDIEYWMYSTGVVSGIPRPANPPASSINNEWQQVYKIAELQAPSGLTNEGVYTIYSLI